MQRVICAFESQESQPVGVGTVNIIPLGLELQRYLTFNQGRDELKMLTKPAHYIVVLRVMLK